MDVNPFEVSQNPVFEDDECLHTFVADMKKTNRLAKHFNPLHHRVANWVISKIFSPKSRIIYSENYVGEDRREVSRFEQAVVDFDEYFRIVFMTRTQKIIDIKE